MKRIEKAEVIKLMAELKAKGFSNEELAVMLSRSSQTIWSWNNPDNKRVPCLSDLNVLKRLLATK